MKIWRIWPDIIRFSCNGLTGCSPRKAPALPSYRAEDDPEWQSWSSLPTQQVLARLSSMRTKLMARLRSLSEEDFERTGVHPKFGAMSLSLWLEFFLVHEAHHLYVVLQLVRR